MAFGFVSDTFGQNVETKPKAPTDRRVATASKAISTFTGNIDGTEPTSFEVDDSSCTIIEELEHYYETFDAIVTVTGDYDYTDVSITYDLDMQLTIYEDSYDPENVLDNCVTRMDDSGTVTLSAETQYVFVVQPLFDSSFNTGDWEFTMDGPGDVNEGLIPVELAGFTAQADGRDVVLTWQTLSETNNTGFAVEQRASSTTWRDVAFVDGAGTTTQRQTYRYEVRNVPYGPHAFRLRQVDIDGTATTTVPVEVDVRFADAYAVAAYPNPVTNGQNAIIDITARDGQRVSVSVYDMLGRRVTSLFDGEVTARNTERLTLPVRGMASGVYLVRVVGERFASTSRITVVR